MENTGDDKERGYAEMTSPGIAGVRTGEDASAPRSCGAKNPGQRAGGEASFPAGI